VAAAASLVVAALVTDTPDQRAEAVNPLAEEALLCRDLVQYLRHRLHASRPLCLENRKAWLRCQEAIEEERLQTRALTLTGRIVSIEHLAVDHFPPRAVVGREHLLTILVEANTVVIRLTDQAVRTL
jgi:hypothetical protein